jgi:hypothetical protein
VLFIAFASFNLYGMTSIVLYGMTLYGMALYGMTLITSEGSTLFIHSLISSTDMPVCSP